MTDYLTLEDLATIEARCEAATTGGPKPDGLLYGHVRTTIPRLVKACRAVMAERDSARRTVDNMAEALELGDSQRVVADAQQLMSSHRSTLERTEELAEALAIIAGRPDRHGKTHGSVLHDVGAVAAFAERALAKHEEARPGG